MSENIKGVGSENPPLKGRELNNVLRSLSQERGIEPELVDKFLKVDAESIKGLPAADKWIPGAAVALHLVTRALVDTYPQMPKGPDLPLLAHNFLQAVYALPNMAASSPALRDHVPYLLFTFGASWAGIKSLPTWLGIEGKSRKVEKLQEKVKGKVEAGEMEYQMKPGHTAAFVGAGDPLADALQNEKGDSMVMQYADVPISQKVWELVKSTGTQEEIFRSLDRGGFESAGEALILPVRAEDMILPGENGHDMSLDEIAAKVRIVKEYCDSRKIPNKRIIMVGDFDHEEVYSRRTGENSTELTKKSLGTLVDELETELKVKIERIDPTKDVMKKVVDLAQGRQIEYHATKVSDERYGQRFYRELEIAGYKPTGAEAVRVFYNINDIPTESHVGLDDLAIVLDESVYGKLTKTGKFKEEHIICAPLFVRQEVGLEIDKS